MNKEAILEFIKKNLLSLICGIVTILCIAAIFYPLGGWLDTMKSEASDQAGSYQTLADSLKKERRKPLSDPGLDPGKLDAMPNQLLIDAGDTAVKKWKSFVNDVVNAVNAGNVHTPLVRDALPGVSPTGVPVSTSTLIKFDDAYKLVLNTDPTAKFDPALASYKSMNLRDGILHGGVPPTKLEIDAAIEALKHSDDPDGYQARIIWKNNVAMNAKDLTDQFRAEVGRLPQRLRVEAALSHKIYCENNAFSFSAAIADDLTKGNPPAPEDVWYAQLGLWIQQDLANAIADANSASKNILDAEVKRLIAIRLDTPDKLYVLSMATGAPGAVATVTGIPSALDETKVIPPDFTVAQTGRYSNGMYDVFHFTLVVDVDASKVNQFIETLSNSKDSSGVPHHRLITVLSQNLYALDPEIESSYGYLYGRGSTVRLELTGEILFMRSWTKDLMPEPVKLHLGLVKTGPGMPGMTGPNGGPNRFPGHVQ